MAEPDLSAAGQLAREGDEERFMAAMFAAADVRERLFALNAFNCELAKIPATVSEPMLGEIRLQWWAEAIDDLFENGKIAGHEAIEALAATREEAGWDRELLETMIEARRFALGGLSTDSAALSEFIANTGGAYHRLAVGALGGRSTAAQDVAGMVGWAEGAGRLIAALPDALSGDRTPSPLAVAAVGLASEGIDKLNAARKRRRDVPRAARAPLLSVRFSEPWLRLAVAGDGQVKEAQDVPRPRFSIFWAALTGRF